MDDDDWGDLEDNDDKNKPSLLGLRNNGLKQGAIDQSAENSKKKNNLFLGGANDDDDFDEVDNFLNDAPED